MYERQKHIKNLENKSHMANFADPDFFVCIDLALIFMFFLVYIVQCHQYTTESI